MIKAVNVRLITDMYLTSVQLERLTILRRNLNVSGLSLGPKTGSGG